MSSYGGGHPQQQYNPRTVGGQPPQLHQPQVTAVNRSVQQPYGQPQPSPSLPRTDVMLADQDAQDRDPNDLNEYLMVTWDNVIAEPEGIRSTDCAWDCSQQCFNITSNCCYILLTTLLAPFAAFFCALNFATCSFLHIWCCVPFLRTWKIQCHCMYTCLAVAFRSVCGPYYETCGLCFSRIKVRYMPLTESKEEDLKDIKMIV